MKKDKFRFVTTTDGGTDETGADETIDAIDDEACEDCDDACGHECAHCRGEDDEPEQAEYSLVIEAREGVTLKGLVGALADLGAIEAADAKTIADKIGLGLKTNFWSAIRDGNRGVEVEIEEGEFPPAERFSSMLATLTESEDDDPASAAAILNDIYAAAGGGCAEEQHVDDPDLGSFARTDILLALALVAEGFSNIESGYATTTVELGTGAVLDNGIPVSRPTTLSALIAADADLEVSVSTGSVGADTPSVAVIAAMAEEQVDDVHGRIVRMGCGIDGDVVTRLYLLLV